MGEGACGYGYGYTHHLQAGSGAGWPVAGVALPGCHLFHAIKGWGDVSSVELFVVHTHASGGRSKTQNRNAEHRTPEVQGA